MAALVGPYLAAVSLLAVAGAAKLARPAATQGALTSVGAPPALASDRAVRLLGAAELALAVVALLRGGTVVALGVAACYAGFTVFVALALARGGAVRSCGCFGDARTPPTRVHLTLNAAATLTAAAVALGGGPGLAHALQSRSLVDVLLLVATATSAWLAYLALSLLPTVATLTGERPR